MAEIRVLNAQEMARVEGGVAPVVGAGIAAAASVVTLTVTKLWNFCRYCR